MYLSVMHSERVAAHRQDLLATAADHDLARSARRAATRAERRRRWMKATRSPALLVSDACD